MSPLLLASLMSWRCRRRRSPSGSPSSAGLSSSDRNRPAIPPAHKGEDTHEKTVTAIATVAALLRPSPLLAHGGGLGRNDCHRETATEGYHCHPRGDEVAWDTIAALAGGSGKSVIRD